MTVSTPVPVGTAPVADLFEVTGIVIRPLEGNVTVHWRKCLRGPDGEVLEVAHGAHLEPLATLGAQFPNGSKSHFQNIKELAYQRLQSAGVFPVTGTLS